jgi:O-antigen/teichoic acid export membrane protein
MEINSKLPVQPFTMQKKTRADISANMLQVVINQGCGLLLFYLLSRLLSKYDFGELNWTLAVWLTLFTTLALGIDQLVVKKVAAGAHPEQVMSAYHIHLLLTGGSTVVLVLLGVWRYPHFFQQHPYLLLLGVGKLLIFFSTLYKQVAIGLERFTALLWMSTVSNIIRATGVLVLWWLDSASIQSILILFVAGDALEWICAWLIGRRFPGITAPFRLGWAHYRSLLYEALPQAGTVIFNMLLTRIDWILLGILCSNTILAEYSFAYKVYEVATMPLLVIAPMLMPRFARWFATTHQRTAEEQQQVRKLLLLQCSIGTAAAILLNLLWMPVVGPLTGNQYAAVNRVTVAWLSCSIPLVFINNYMWTIFFSQQRLRQIFIIIVCSGMLNIAANLWLIPRYQGEGAAMAFTLSMLVQCMAYVVWGKAWRLLRLVRSN